MKQKTSKKIAWGLAAALCASALLPATCFAMQSKAEKSPFKGASRAGPPGFSVMRQDRRRSARAAWGDPFKESGVRKKIKVVEGGKNRL